MGEVYTGAKFRTVFARRAVSGDERLGELLKWCRRWAALGLVGDTVGNLSFRTVNGFIINRTAGDLGGITRQEFVEVLEADGEARQLTVVGLYEPSSESLMHAGIYAARPEVELVAEILQVLDGHKFVIMRRHGFVSLGGTMEEAGRNAEEILKRL
jgi:ribulose-5-phosphate 4-epimerase/fuculose-1-phosphate aldolase